MTFDAQKLRALAEAATQPGPWVSVVQDGNATVLDAHGMWVADCGAAPEDAEFIAAVSPDVVIAMLDDNAQLRSACAKWQEIFTGFPHDAQQALRELLDEVERLRAEVARDVNADFWSAYDYARQDIEHLHKQLAAMTAARDEACDLAEEYLFGRNTVVTPEREARIQGLRAVGGGK